jgi:hypothetical protein
VTLVSIGSVFGLATLMLILVPVGRSLLATGGECAGAAAAVIASEACAVVALLLQYAESPLDPRNVSVLIKSAGISAVVLTLNHFLFDLGAVRLVAVMLLYVGLGWALRVIKPAEVVWAIRMMRTSRGGLPETAGPHAIG